MQKLRFTTQRLELVALYPELAFFAVDNRTQLAQLLNASLSMRQLIFSLATAIALSTTLTSCSTLTTDQYEATALTKYTWQVKVANDLANETSPRFETFANTELLNRNGNKPDKAVTGPDDRGLWWPSLPPRPTVDEVEGRKQGQEASKPELLKSVEYKLTYGVGEQQRTLPTNALLCLW